MHHLPISFYCAGNLLPAFPLFFKAFKEGFDFYLIKRLCGNFLKKFIGLRRSKALFS
jgi:hypothetical protein